MLVSCKGETFLSRKYTKGHYFSFRERTGPTQGKSPLKINTKVVLAEKSDPGKLKKETETLVSKRDFLDTLKNYSSLNLLIYPRTKEPVKKNIIRKKSPVVPDTISFKNKYRHHSAPLRSARSISIVGLYYAWSLLVAMSFLIFILAFYIYTGFLPLYFLVPLVAAILFTAWFIRYLFTPRPLG